MSKTRVLVVSDFVPFRSVLTKALQRLGFAAHGVGTVAEALEAVENWHPDAIVLELLLPDDNGTVVLHHIRERRLPIKVAMYSAPTNLHEHPRVEQLKPDLILDYPLDIFTVAGWLGPAHRLEP